MGKRAGHEGRGSGLGMRKRKEDWGRELGKRNKMDILKAERGFT